MPKITTFFQTFIKSLTSPEYYRDVVKANSAFSWKYFLVLNLLLALVVSFRLLPLARLDVSGIIEDAFDVYPAELVVTADEEGITINQELPYRISMPAKLVRRFDPNMKFSDFRTLSQFALVTFDSDENVQNFDDIYDAKSLVVITPSYVYSIKNFEDQEVSAKRIEPISETFSFDAGDVSYLENKILEHPVVSRKLYIPILMFVILMGVLPATLIFKTLMVAIYAFFAWVASSIFMNPKNLGFGKILQISLHTFTLTLMLSLIADFAPQNMPALEMISSGWGSVAIFMIWTLFVINQLPSGRSKAAPKKKRAKSRVKKK